MPPATDLVHALKYEGWGELAGFMGRSMAGAVDAEEGRPDPRLLLPEVSMPWHGFAADAVVVAVPTTAARARSRGYNQAALLANVVASQLELPAAPDALRRLEARASQTTLRPDERRENVRGVFERGPEGGRVRGRRVLLIDDVLTTGATAAEAAAALRNLGSGEVRLITFARAFPEQGRTA